MRACFSLSITAYLTQVKILSVSYTQMRNKREFSIIMCDSDTGLVLGQSRKIISPDDYQVLDKWLHTWIGSFLRGSANDSRDIALQITCRNVVEEIKLPF